MLSPSILASVITRAAIDRAELECQDRARPRKYVYHFPYFYDCCIKVRTGITVNNSPAIRGAVAWALRTAGRSVTLCGGDDYILG